MAEVHRRWRAAAGRGRRGCGCLLVLCLVLAAGIASALVPDLRHGITARIPYWTTLRAHLPLGSAQAVPPVACRGGDVLAVVQDPAKLTLLSPCAVGTGVVVAKFRNRDGDWHLHILPTNLATTRLLDKRNLLVGAGTLVCEVVPADQGTVSLPRLGARVRITGALVRDSEFGWHELHPAWQVVVLSGP